jgi:hypothetical protein
MRHRVAFGHFLFVSRRLLFGCFGEAIYLNVDHVASFVSIADARVNIPFPRPVQECRIDNRVSVI